MKLIALVILSIAFTTANSQTISSGILAPISPIMTVISVTKFFADIIGDRIPEYLIKIRVTDRDQQTAKTLAFKEACNQAFGSVISTELESNNQQLTRDNVTNYSSCYVKNHKVLSVEQNQVGEFVLLIDVTVTSNKIANRALGSSSATNQFDGEKHIDTLNSFQESKQEEDKILTSVLRDYPGRAFDLEIQNSNVAINNYRNGRLEINFVASLNQGYLDSLQDTFKTVGTVPRINSLDQRPVSNNLAQVSILTESNGLFVGTNKINYYQFPDMITYKSISDRLGAPMNLMMQVRIQSGKWYNFACINAPFNDPAAQPNLLNFGVNNTGIINSRKKLKYTLVININSATVSRQISGISDIKLVPTLNTCPGNHELGTTALFV